MCAYVSVCVRVSPGRHVSIKDDALQSSTTRRSAARRVAPQRTTLHVHAYGSPGREMGPALVQARLGLGRRSAWTLCTPKAWLPRGKFDAEAQVVPLPQAEAVLAAPANAAVELWA